VSGSRGPGAKTLRGRERVFPICPRKKKKDVRKGQGKASKKNGEAGTWGRKNSSSYDRAAGVAAQNFARARGTEGDEGKKKAEHFARDNGKNLERQSRGAGVLKRGAERVRTLWRGEAQAVDSPVGQGAWTPKGEKFGARRSH